MNKYGFTDSEWQETLVILKKYSEIDKVVLFGSRAKNTFKPMSDVDIVLYGNDITYQTISALQSDFDDSQIPYFFDIIDYKKISSDELKQHIYRYGKIILGRKKSILDEWKEVNLVNCLETVIDYRGKTPKKSSSGILTLSAKSVKMGYIDYSQAYYISKKTYDAFMNRGFPKVGDILMTTEAPLGCIAKLDRDNVGIAQRLLTLRGKNNVLYNDYLMYYLISRKGQHELQSRASGSTVQGIKRTEFEKVNILLPEYKEQKAIAKILTTFDDKIELLQAQNKTLESIAQIIFKEWFGKYQIGDDLPEGWRVGKLGELALHIKDSVKPFKFPKEIFVHYSLPAYDDGLVPISEMGELIKSNKYLVKSKTILVSKLNPFTPRIWTVYNAEKNHICSTEFQVLSPKKEFYFTFLHSFLNSRFYTKEISKNIQGTSSSHQRIRPENIFNLTFVIPDDKAIIDYEKSIGFVILKKEINHNQIQSLKQTRDTLLPKLMSGEIRVNDYKENTV